MLTHVLPLKAVTAGVWKEPKNSATLVIPLCGNKM
jgi:hypothetical protein